MAAFPSNVKFGFKDLGEEPGDIVARTEMERGVPKQRRTQADVLVKQTITMYFDTKAEAASFETFFYTTINAGQDWFDWTDVRTGVVVQARAVKGHLGPLRAVTRDFTRSMREMPIEWLKAVL